jgi:purine-binding chemotaxis protein CheW
MSSEPPLDATGTAATAKTAPLLAFADGLLAAGRAEPAQNLGEIRQYVTFVLRDQELAISILDCREILRAPVITRIPEAPAEVRGVVNLRGRIVPAVDVRVCLGMEPASLNARTRLLVVEVQSRLFALIVDRVARILKLASAQVSPAAAGSFASVSGTAKIGDTSIHIIDSERLLIPAVVTAAPTEKE